MSQSVKLTAGEFLLHRLQVPQMIACLSVRLALWKAFAQRNIFSNLLIAEDGTLLPDRPREVASVADHGRTGTGDLRETIYLRCKTADTMSYNTLIVAGDGVCLSGLDLLTRHLD